MFVKNCLIFLFTLGWRVMRCMVWKGFSSFPFGLGGSLRYLTKSKAWPSIPCYFQDIVFHVLTLCGFSFHYYCVLNLAFGNYATERSRNQLCNHWWCADSNTNEEAAITSSLHWQKFSEWLFTKIFKIYIEQVAVTLHVAIVWILERVMFLFYLCNVMRILYYRILNIRNLLSDAVLGVCERLSLGASDIFWCFNGAWKLR